MKKITKIIGVAALLAVSSVLVSCGAVEEKVEEVTNQKFEASNAIEKQNPEVKKNLEKPVSSSEDLEKVISDCITETTKEILGIPDLFGARAAAKDVKSAEKQAEEFVTDLYAQLKKSYENEKVAIDFDKKIDIEAITIKDVFTVAVDAYNATCEDAEDEMTVNQALSILGIEDIINSIDELVALDKFKFALELSASEEKQKASIDESLIVAASVGDVNKLVSVILDGDFDAIPVKGAAVSATQKLAGSVSGEDYKIIFPDENEEESEEESEEVIVKAPTIKGFKASEDVQISLAVLTKSKAGGYFTIEVESAIEQEQLNEIVELANDTDVSIKEYEAKCVKLADSIFTVTISVSDGKKDTYKETYNFTKLSKLLSKCGVDLSDIIESIF